MSGIGIWMETRTPFQMMSPCLKRHGVDILEGGRSKRSSYLASQKYLLMMPRCRRLLQRGPSVRYTKHLLRHRRKAVPRHLWEELWRDAQVSTEVTLRLHWQA